MSLIDSLAHHSLSNFHEAGDVSALHVVDVSIGLFAVLDALLVNVAHDFMKFLIHVFGAPLDMAGVLAHFQTGSGHTTGIDSLAGCVGDACGDECVDSLGGATHIGNLGNELYLIVDKLLGIVTVEFVLCGARQCDVHLLLPGLTTCIECRTGEFVGIRSNNIVARSAEFEHIVDFLGIQAGGIVNVSVRAGDGNHLGAKFGSLESRSPSHVTETADSNSLTLDFVFLLAQNALYKVESTEAGSFGTYTAAAEGHTLARECTGALVGQFFVHTVHVSDFTSTYAYVAGGHILVGTEVLPKLEDEGLAETHDFAITLATGREVATALTTAHRQSCQSVLEGLLKAEELENGQIDRCVETDTAFIRAYSVVELYAVAYIVLDFALIINPSNAEGEDTVRLDNALYDFIALELGVLVVDLFNRHEDFLHCLEILFLARVLSFQVKHDFINIHN